MCVCVAPSKGLHRARVHPRSPFEALSRTLTVPHGPPEAHRSPRTRWRPPPAGTFKATNAFATPCRRHPRNHFWTGRPSRRPFVTTSTLAIALCEASSDASFRSSRPRKVFAKTSGRRKRPHQALLHARTRSMGPPHGYVEANCGLEGPLLGQFRTTALFRTAFQRLFARSQPHDEALPGRSPTVGLAKRGLEGASRTLPSVEMSPRAASSHG